MKNPLRERERKDFTREISERGIPGNAIIAARDKSSNDSRGLDSIYSRADPKNPVTSA